MRPWLAMGLAVAMAVSAQGQSSHPPDSTPAPANDAFARLRGEWARNLHEKRVEASVAEYAADAEFIDPSGSRFAGSDALRGLFATVTKTFDSDLTFTSKRVEGSGDLSYDSGTYTETLVVRATGKVQQASGSYLTVYRRGKDAHWLIVEQVWTGSVSDATDVSQLAAHRVVALTFDDPPAARRSANEAARACGSTSPASDSTRGQSATLRAAADPPKCR